MADRLPRHLDRINEHVQQSEASFGARTLGIADLVSPSLPRVANLKASDYDFTFSHLLIAYLFVDACMSLRLLEHTLVLWLCSVAYHDCGSTGEYITKMLFFPHMCRAVACVMSRNESGDMYGAPECYPPV